jgi:predicted ATPase
MEEARLCSYYHKIFCTPPWPEIYRLDNERWEEYGYAEKIHDYITKFYSELGYELVEIPKLDISARVDFILSALKSDFPGYPPSRI